MPITSELIVLVCVNVAAVGVFVGVTRTSLATILERLKQMEDKQDRQNDEIVKVRERVAVIESKLDIKQR